MNQWIDEWANLWSDELVSPWGNESMSERMNGWMVGWVSCFFVELLLHLVPLLAGTSSLSSLLPYLGYFSDPALSCLPGPAAVTMRLATPAAIPNSSSGNRDPTRRQKPHCQKNTGFRARECFHPWIQALPNCYSPLPRASKRHWIRYVPELRAFLKYASKVIN